MFIFFWRFKREEDEKPQVYEKQSNDNMKVRHKDCKNVKLEGGLR